MPRVMYTRKKRPAVVIPPSGGGGGSSGGSGDSGSGGGGSSSGSGGSSPPTSIPLGTGVAALLMHFDGANNSTSFTNSSSDTTLSCAALGSAVISTGTSRFGSSSVYINGNGIRVSPSTAIGLIGSTPFTIEMQLNPTTVNTTTRQIVSKWSNTDPGWALGMVSGSLRWVQNNGVTTSVYTFGPGLVAGVWQHIAITKDGNNAVRAFINGVQVGSTITPSTIRSTNANVVIGDLHSPAATQPFLGYIDELMISSGYALYTSNFTPPALPYS